MEGNTDMFRGSPTSSSSSSLNLSSNSRRFGLLSASNIIQAPLSLLLEYSGILPSRSNQHQPNSDVAAAPSDGEVSIRIIGSAEHDHQRREEQTLADGDLVAENDAVDPSQGGDADGGVSRTGNGGGNAEAGGGGGEGAGPNGRDSSYQRYDIQHAARWIEQVLPFSLLLLVVFIRQHLQGFFCYNLDCCCPFQVERHSAETNGIEGVRLCGPVFFSVHGDWETVCFCLCM